MKVLKTMDTIGNCQLVSLNICIKYQTCENFSLIGRRKKNLVTRSFVLSDALFRDLKFET